MKLGFVGTGAITQAIVEGLLSKPSADLEIILSPRGEAISRLLVQSFPSQVRRAPDNQSVLDAADVVVLAVRPQVVRDVAAGLRFRPEHVVLSLVATLSADDLAAIAAPARRLVRAVPLPSVALAAGPTAIIPADPLIVELFGRVGTAIGVDNEDSYHAMVAATAIMASHLAFAATVEGWLAAQGVPAADASRYVRQILAGLARTMEREAQTPLSDLSAEHETKGGLNEQLRRTLENAGLFDELAKGLDALSMRIRGIRPD